MLICREVAEGANVTGENGSGKIITLLGIAVVGYLLWREYDKQQAPKPTAPTVATTGTDGRMGQVTDVNPAIDQAV